MIVDSHAHVSLPIKDYLDIMDEAGIDRAILFATAVHPEQANDAGAFEAEMGRLDRVVLAGGTSLEARSASMRELVEMIGRYPLDKTHYQRKRGGKRGLRRSLAKCA